MLIPEYLKPGDTIAIVATARKVSASEMQPAINKFQEWGLKVVKGRNLYNADNQFSGTDEERAADLQWALDDPTVKAVIIARGGYGTVKIIDSIDFSRFKQHPKWIAGYSDITVLHMHIRTNCGIETIHSVMPINFPPDGSSTSGIETLKRALFGDKLEYRGVIPEQYKSMIRSGKAEAELIGGNLSLVYALTGTPSDIDTTGKILFIEDLDEYLYHMDRMMMNLKRSGRLNGLAGLIVGGMSDMKDNTIPFGKTAEEIIFDAVKEYDYPVLFGFPAGHIPDNRALIFGRKITLSVKDDSFYVAF